MLDEGSSLSCLLDLSDPTGPGRGWKGAQRQVNGPFAEGSAGQLSYLPWESCAVAGLTQVACQGLQP